MRKRDVATRLKLFKKSTLENLIDTLIYLGATANEPFCCPAVLYHEHVLPVLLLCPPHFFLVCAPKSDIKMETSISGTDRSRSY